MQFFKENLATSNIIFVGRTFRIEKDEYEFEFFKISLISDSKLHIALDIMQDHYLSIIHSLQNKADYEMFSKQIFQNSLNSDIQIFSTFKDQLGKIREIESERLSKLQSSLNLAEYELKQLYSPKFEQKTDQSFSPISTPINPTIIKIKYEMDKLIDKISKESLNKIYKLLSIRNDKNETAIINGIISLILNVQSAKPSICAKYVGNYKLFNESLKKFNGSNISKEIYQYISKDVSSVLPFINRKTQNNISSPEKLQNDYSHIFLYRDWLLFALEIVKLFLKENFAEEKEDLDRISFKQFSNYNLIKEKVKVMKIDIDSSLFDSIKIAIGSINNSISFINEVLESDKHSDLVLGKFSIHHISNYNREFQTEISMLYSNNKYPKKILSRADKIRFDENIPIQIKGKSLCFFNECINK